MLQDISLTHDHLLCSVSPRKIVMGGGGGGGAACISMYPLINSSFTACAPSSQYTVHAPKHKVTMIPQQHVQK